MRVKSEIAKHGVHCGACVSFGHNNAVAVLFFGIFRVDVCFVVVNDGKRVHDRHRAADMSDTEVSDNFDCVVTEFSGFCRQEIEFLFSIYSSLPEIDFIIYCKTRPCQSEFNKMFSV